MGTTERTDTAWRPTRRALLIGGTTTAAALALGACSSSGGGGAKSGGTTVAPTTTSPTPGSDVTGNRWPLYGHDLAQTRTNLAEKTITADTLGSLTETWRIEDLVGVTGTPVVDDGVVYFTDWTGAARAVHADTGDEVWHTEALGGMFVAAPAVTADAVYVAVDKTLYRLDKATGEQKWKTEVNPHPQAQINASPVVVDDIVLQGCASFENMMAKDDYTFRGTLGAYDVDTGEEKWVFHATEGNEKAGAGGGIWSTPAVDTTRKLCFVGTGQGLEGPTPPMADSIVAIDYTTGEKKWHRQFTYPDVFSAAHPEGKDADVGASPNLWTIDGRDVVGACDKGGTFHTCDRDTGELVWETELTPGSAFGGAIGSAAYVDGVIVASSNIGNPESNFPTEKTLVFGLDPATGKQKWKSEEFDGKIFAPVSAVTGVAFCGTDKGQLFALDTADGTTLWTMDAPAMTACGPSIVDGRIHWGYGFILFGGPGEGGILTLEPEV